MKDGRGYSNINRTSDFYNNVKIAQQAEFIVKDLVEQLFEDLTNIKWVGQDEKYFHTGDIIGTDIWGDIVGYEVKDDGSAAKTGNIFCEHTKISKDGSMPVAGFMRREMGDYLCVVSRATKHVWFFDFAELRKIYTQGRYVHCKNQTDSEGYLLAIAALRRDGQLLLECDYIFDDWGMVMPQNVKWYE